MLFTGIGRKILEKKLKTKSILKVEKIIKAKNRKLINLLLHHITAFCVAQLIGLFKKMMNFFNFASDIFSFLLLFSQTADLKPIIFGFNFNKSGI